MRTLKFNVDCGEATCSDVHNHKVCKYWTTHPSDGVNGYCELFGKKLKKNDEGWSLRCAQCLKKEAK